jgi:hypothetical protein
MKIRSMALVLLVALGVLVACHGTSTYVPQGGVNMSDATLPLDGHWPSGVWAANTSQICAGVPYSKVGKTYTEIVAVGNLSGSTFMGEGSWFSEKYALGSPATPTPGHTPEPGKIPAWAYYGSFTLKKHKETGCAIVIVTENGKPWIFEKTEKFNADSGGFVIVNPKEHWHISGMTGFGFLTESLTITSSTSGGGQAMLKTETGQAYDTATITLVGRTPIKVKKIKEKQ